MKRNLLKTLFVATGLAMTVAGYAAEGDVTTNANIDFSNAITDGKVAGTVGEIVIGQNDSYPTEINADGRLVLGKGTHTVTIPEEQRARNKDKVTISFDLAVGKLIKRTVSFGMQDAEGNNIGSFEMCAYDGTVTTDLGIEVGDMYYGYNTVIWDRATKFTITLDYAAGTITTNSESPNAANTTNTHTVQMTNMNSVATFTIGSSYDNLDRRCEFDNLLIQTTEGNYPNLDPVSIYERGTTTAWSDADVAEWTGATLTVDPTYGLGIDGNGTYTATKTLDGVVANSKMTYTGTWHVGSSTGRDANFAWIQFGDGLRLSWGNYYSLRVTFNGESSTSGTEIYKGSNTVFDFPFSITINTATKAIEKFEFNGEDITETFAGVAVEGENFNTISQGFIRGGSVGWTIPNFLTNIEVIQQQQDLSTASYTIKYVDGEGNEVREAVVRSGVIGNPIVLASTDTENFFTEGETPVKYIYVSNDAEGKTIEAGDATVITVTFRQAATMHYTVSASIADQTIALVDSSYFEGETVYYNFPRYYAIDGALYQKPEGEKDPGFYRGSAVLTEDNQAITVTGYSLIDTVNVAYFSEAEDINGLTLSSNTTAEVRMSMGKTAFNGGTEPVTIVTLPAGKYKIFTTTWGSAGQTFTFYAGDVDILMAECTGSSADASAEFTLMEETAITLAGDPEITNGGIDYVLIDKIGDVVVEQADATFDFNANAWGLPVGSNDDQTAGNIGDNTIEEGGVVLSFTDGGTPTRMWGTPGETQLRAYTNGTMTVAAPQNMVITKMEFETTQGEYTVNTGAFDGATWTGNADSVIVTFTSQTRFDKIDVYLAAAPAVVVENIAALKALPAGTMARLTLKDTKITVKAQTMMGVYTILEDETGATMIAPDMTGMVGDITTMFPEQFANDSVALNGYLYTTMVDMGGYMGMAVCDSTASSQITATPCEITPTVIEIADAANADNNLRLVQLQKVTLGADYTLSDGANSITIQDMLSVMPVDEKYDLIVPENKIDINGFILTMGELGTYFVPVGNPPYTENAPDAIDGVNADADALNGDVYSINGVKVRNAGESLDGLKGLYIINGKKVVLD